MTTSHVDMYAEVLVDDEAEFLDLAGVFGWEFQTKHYFPPSEGGKYVALYFKAENVDGDTSPAITAEATKRTVALKEFVIGTAQHPTRWLLDQIKMS